MISQISLQVKYFAQAFLTGDVIAVREKDFVYSEGDCLSKWLSAGRLKEDWKSAFVKINISDCDDANHPSLQKLTTPFSDDPDAPYQRKHFLQMPANQDDPHRVSMRSTGETTATLAEIEALTSERV